MRFDLGSILGVYTHIFVRQISRPNRLIGFTAAQVDGDFEFIASTATSRLGIADDINPPSATCTSSNHSATLEDPDRPLGTTDSHKNAPN